MSSLEALSSFKLELDLVRKIIKNYTLLTNSGKKKLFYVGFRATSIYQATRELIPQPSQLFPCLQAATHKKFPAYDLIPRVSRFCKAEWQDIWSCCSGNKLYSIYPTVVSVLHNKFLSRHDTVINRLRIDHTRLTHSYLLSRDDQPTCNTRGLPLTVYHILVECSNLNVIRQRYFTVNTLKDLFQNVDSRFTIDFVKESIFIVLCNFNPFLS